MAENLNERVAREVMGWNVPKQSSEHRVNPATGLWLPLPDFAHSLDACAIAEAEIERRGLSESYRVALLSPWKMSPGAGNVVNLAHFLIRLTPAQRCEAMLKAVSHA